MRFSLTLLTFLLASLLIGKLSAQQLPSEAFSEDSASIRFSRAILNPEDGHVLMAGGPIPYKPWPVNPGFILNLDSNVLPEWNLCGHINEVSNGDSSSIAIAISCLLPFHHSIIAEGGTLNGNGLQTLIMKLDEAGHILWLKKYKGLPADHPHQFLANCISRDDQSFILAGLYVKGWHPYSFWMRVDTNGDHPTVRTLMSGKNYHIAKIFAGKNHESIIAGYLGNPDKLSAFGNEIFPLFLKLDSSGNLLDKHEIVLPQSATLEDCTQTSDGGFLCIGNGRSAAYSMKIDSAFNPVWVRKYFLNSSQNGLDRPLSSILQVGTNQFLISGKLITEINNSYEPLLFKIDSTGKFEQGILVTVQEGTNEGADEVVALPKNRYEVFDNAINIEPPGKGYIHVFEMDSNFNMPCTPSPYTVAEDTGSVLFSQLSKMESDSFPESWFGVLDEKLIPDPPLRYVNSCGTISSNETIKIASIICFS